MVGCERSGWDGVATLAYNDRVVCVCVSADYQKLMQHNKWQTDPLQLGSAANGVMARYDLVKSDPDAFGGIDSKVTDHVMAMKGQTFAMNGPTKLTQPVFEWTSKWQGDVHLGEPDRFDYEYQLMQPQPPCVW